MLWALAAPAAEPVATFVALEASPARVAPGGSTTLIWRVPAGTPCLASGGWTGPRTAGGRETTGPLATTTTFTLDCHGSRDEVTVAVASDAATRLFPLRSEQGSRFLVDVRGNPFLINGDAAWSLIAQLDRRDVDRYLDERKRQGFNTVLVELVEHKFSDDPPNNAYGQAPFLTVGDFSRPNPRYFDHAEYVVAGAAARGMLVLLAPTYTGYKGGDQGWYREMTSMGPARMRDYARFVARRFRSYDNVAWVFGGDFEPPERRLMHAIVAGFQDVESDGLRTFHGDRGRSALDYLGTDERWLNLDSIYTDDSNVVLMARTEYQRTTLPFFLIEAHYENEHDADARTVRRQAYQALLGGACGHVMGNNPVWKFGPGWQGALSSPGARSMTHLRQLFDSIAWERLIPDQTGSFVRAGFGPGLPAVGAVDREGIDALVYVPNQQAIVLDMSRLRGPRVEARWFDPTNGRFRAAAPAKAASSGLQTYSPDGNNSAGADDWVLTLRSVP